VLLKAIRPKNPASMTNRENRLWKAYAFFRDLQAAANRLLFKSCSPVKMLKIKALYSYSNRAPTGFAEGSLRKDGECIGWNEESQPAQSVRLRGFNPASSL
jgi:hypothetical protein